MLPRASATWVAVRSWNCSSSSACRWVPANTAGPVEGEVSSRPAPTRASSARHSCRCGRTGPGPARRRSRSRGVPAARARTEAGPPRRRPPGRRRARPADRGCQLRHGEALPAVTRSGRCSPETAGRGARRRPARPRWRRPCMLSPGPAPPPGRRWPGRRRRAVEQPLVEQGPGGTGGEAAGPLGRHLREVVGGDHPVHQARRSASVAGRSSPKNISSLAAPARRAGAGPGSAAVGLPGPGARTPR